MTVSTCLTDRDGLDGGPGWAPPPQGREAVPVCGASSWVTHLMDCPSYAAVEGKRPSVSI